MLCMCWLSLLPLLLQEQAATDAVPAGPDGHATAAHADLKSHYFQGLYYHGNHHRGLSNSDLLTGYTGANGLSVTESGALLIE